MLNNITLCCGARSQKALRARFTRLINLLVALVFVVSLASAPSGHVQARTAHFAENALDEVLTYVGDIGGATSKTSDTSLAITTTAAAAEGDDIIIVYATDPNQNIPPITIVDSVGNAYSEVGYALNSGQLRTYIFAAFDINALPAGSTITITANAAVTARAAVVSVFRGLENSEVVDQTSSGENDSSTSASSGATPTTTQAAELLIGGIGTEGPSEDTAGTWQNSFTAGPRLGTTGGTADTNMTVAMGWRIVSDVGSYTAAKTGMTQRDHAAVITTFKAAPSGDSPRITVTGTPLGAFASMPGSPSAVQSYQVSGINLTGDISITAPADFQVSLDSEAGFLSSLTLPQEGGSVAETPIYVRFNRATDGTSAGSISHSSSGASTRNVAVSGTATLPEFNILLGRPTDHSITVNVIPNQNVDVYYEYGITSGSYPAHTDTYSATAGVPLETVIDGLSTNTRYFYRIVSRIAGMPAWIEGEEHSFITQRAQGSTFTFTIISDSHLGQYGGQTADEYALYEQTLLNIAADQPDFHIDLGDTFAMDPSPLGTGMTEAEADAAYEIQRPYLGMIAHSAPVYLVIGNHENEEGWNFDDVFTPPDQSLARVGMKYRKLYYPNPIPDDFYTGNVNPLDEAIGGDTNHEDYYAWTWGDALFVVLDPYHYSMTWPNDYNEGYGGEGQDGEASGDRWDWSLGIEQYLWFKNVLETSNAKYKFVFSHHVTGGETPYGRGGIDAAPYFEWGGQNADGSWGWDAHRPASEGWDLPIHQLMVANGVSIYFHGHDHIFAYEELDGIVYLECPKPDDAGYTWEPYGYGYSEDLYLHGDMLQNSGHIRVTVSPTEVTGEYVRSYLPGDGNNGQVDYTFTALPNQSTTNVAPVAADDTYTTSISTALNVPAPGVLLNDSDANLDPLTAVKIDDPQHGDLTLNEDGSFTYTPASGYSGDDTFTYLANDGDLDSNTATVTVHVGNITPPVLPSSFYGDIHILTDPPAAGQLVQAYVSGVADPVATATINNTTPLNFALDVPGDLTGTPAKDGGVSGDTVTFRVNGRVVATHAWVSGTNVRLDFHPPEAISGGPYSANEGASISFSGSGDDWGSDSAAYQWDWNNDGEYDATGQHPSHTWADNGTATVGLKVTDAQGGEGATTFIVTIHDVLPTNVDAGGPYSGSAGQSITLTGSATCAAVDTCAYAWELDGDGAYDDATGTSASYSWSAAGDYTIGLRVTDDDGNAVTDTAAVHVIAGATAIPLVAGWNLVSFNLHPGDAAIAAVLDSLADNYDLVYAWDAETGRWLRYAPNVGYGDTLTSLDETMGFWIRMTATDTLAVTGTPPTQSNIALKTGWNLVGFPGSTDLALPEAFSAHGVGDDFSLVYTYHTADTDDVWKKFDRTAPMGNDLTDLTPGYGYWVQVSVDHTWDVDY